MEPTRDPRPPAEPAPRLGRQAASRCAGVAIAIVVMLVVVALQCDVYGAFAEGGPMRFDGSALRTLLATVGFGDTSASH